MKDLKQEILLDLTDEVILHSYFVELRDRSSKKDLIERIRKEAKGNKILISFWRGTVLEELAINREILLKALKGGSVEA